MVSSFVSTQPLEHTSSSDPCSCAYHFELCDELVPFSSAQLVKYIPLDKAIKRPNSIATRSELEGALNQLVYTAPRMEGARLKAAYLLGRRSADKFDESIELSTPQAVASYCFGYYAEKLQEHFRLICLTAKNEVISAETLSVGTLDKTLVAPRDICRRALVDNACSIILVHNHPSGDPHPSQSDITFTQRVVKAASLFEITVLDHIVIGKDERYYSLKSHGDL